MHKLYSTIDKRLDAFLKYTFATLLFFIPLYPKFPLFSVPGTYVAVRAEDFILSFLGLILLVLLFRPDFRRFLFSSPFLLPISLYSAVGIISLINGAYLTHTTSLTLGFLHWLRRIEYFLPFFAAAYLVKDQHNFRFFLKLTIPIAMMVFAYGLAQIYLNAPVISTQNSEFAKGYALTLQPGVNLSSTFAGHYDLSAYLTMILILGSALLFVYRQPFIKSLHVVSLFCLYWLQLQTGSRITFFTTILCISLLFWFTSHRRLISLVLILGIFGALTTPSLSGRFGTLINVFKFDSIEQKVKGAFHTRGLIVVKPVLAAESASPSATPSVSITPPPPPERPIQQDRSTSIRLDVEWPRAFSAFYKNPFLGTGFNSLTLATDNDFLRALGETGALGLVSWLTIFVTLITSYVRLLKNNPSLLTRYYVLGSLLVLISFGIVSIFLDIFESSKPAILFWMYAGLAAGLANKTKHEKKP